MNLLTFHLGKLGYHAFVTDQATAAAAPFALKVAGARIRRRHRSLGKVAIAVYPEVAHSNPYRAPVVVRYLLNAPGYLSPGADRTFGADDFFLAYDPAYAPVSPRTFDMFMPLVDEATYFEPNDGSGRSGFVVLPTRTKIDPSSLPGWVTPCRIISDGPRLSHGELAEIYRHSRAAIAFERTSAIFEALSCGCPVICIERSGFEEATYQRRLRGAGLVWGWHEDRIEAASARAREFKSIYAALKEALPASLDTAFQAVVAEAERRAAARRAEMLSLLRYPFDRDKRKEIRAARRRAEA